MYWLALLGLKSLGHSSFGELGPQEFVLIVLLSEGMSQGLAHENSGFWGSVASAAVLLGMVGMIERWPNLRQWVDGKPVLVMKPGKGLDEETMKRWLVERDDLEKVVRDYGIPTLEAFESMTWRRMGALPAC